MALAAGIVIFTHRLSRLGFRRDRPRVSAGLEERRFGRFDAVQGAGLDSAFGSITSLYPNTAGLTNVLQSPVILVLQAVVTNSDYPIMFKLATGGSEPPVFSPPVLVRSEPQPQK